MKELFSNPVTLIAIVLSAFFVAMAVAKRLGGRRTTSEKDASEKPYQVSDPFTPPPQDAAPPEEEPATIIPLPSQKVFRQFGSESERTADKDYVWE